MFVRFCSFQRERDEEGEREGGREGGGGEGEREGGRGLGGVCGNSKRESREELRKGDGRYCIAGPKNFQGIYISPNL